ncbi:hypothetical protein [Volucribacter amazonae]|uniref:Lipoprotein n=1 Tax=Volucribacter amazonae TaxID=256731 RepID=A0A9X4SIQ5_9PAST|nr:hypothetical protein [Volucribacter amazonae]MDG6895920.1 hypothetical protein [Volucribacter amazonae]
MKKQLIFIILSFLLLACSSQSPTLPQAPLDMQTVAAYNAKVYSGNTVPLAQQKGYQEVDMPMNASDNQGKVKRQSMGSNPIILMPSVGYHYWRYR